jgi:hypothetical protein
MADLDWTQYDESTKASWLWAFLFGPIWFVWHGFYRQAFIVFLLNLVLIGIIVAPFLAYPAWRERAKTKAEKERMIRAMERAGK